MKWDPIWKRVVVAVILCACSCAYLGWHGTSPLSRLEFWILIGMGVTCQILGILIVVEGILRLKRKK